MQSHRRPCKGHGFQRLIEATSTVVTRTGGETEAKKMNWKPAETTCLSWACVSACTRNVLPACHRSKDPTQKVKSAGQPREFGRLGGNTNQAALTSTSKAVLHQVALASNIRKHLVGVLHTRFIVGVTLTCPTSLLWILVALARRQEWRAPDQVEADGASCTASKTPRLTRLKWSRHAVASRS